MSWTYHCKLASYLWWRVLYSTKYFNHKYELMCINCLNVPVFLEIKTFTAELKNRFCIFLISCYFKTGISNHLVWEGITHKYYNKYENRIINMKCKQRDEDSHWFYLVFQSFTRILKYLAYIKRKKPSLVDSIR